MYEREIFGDEDFEPLDDMPEHRVESIRRQREFYQRLKKQQAAAIEAGNEKAFIRAVAGASNGWPTDPPQHKD